MIAVAAVLLAAAVPVFAHHAFGSEFDPNRPLLLKGKIVRIEWVNPHAWIHMEVTNTDGTKDVWMIEGGSPNSLLRLGFTMNAVKYGMEIVVDGYQAKDGANRGVGVSLTFTDGKKLFLGSNAPGGKGQ